MIFFLLSVFSLLFPSTAFAAAWTGNCVGGPDNDVATISGIECIVKNLITPAASLVGLAALFMLILSGARLMLAGSDPKAYASAWSTFTWALIGLILLPVAWLILVVIENFTGAPVTQFGV